MVCSDRTARCVCCMRFVSNCGRARAVVCTPPYCALLCAHMPALRYVPCCVLCCVVLLCLCVVSLSQTQSYCVAPFWTTAVMFLTPFRHTCSRYETTHTYIHTHSHTHKHTYNHTDRHTHIYTQTFTSFSLTSSMSSLFFISSTGVHISPP